MHPLGCSFAHHTVLSDHCPGPLLMPNGSCLRSGKIDLCAIKKLAETQVASAVEFNDSVEQLENSPVDVTSFFSKASTPAQGSTKAMTFSRSTRQNSNDQLRSILDQCLACFKSSTTLWLSTSRNACLSDGTAVVFLNFVSHALNRRLSWETISSTSSSMTR